MIKKADVVLTIVLVIIGAGLSYYFTTGGQAGDNVIISINKEKKAEYSLMEDRTVVIQNGGIADCTPSEEGKSRENHKENYNIINISDGQVTVTDADCGGGDCLRQGPISNTGETIVCLPHKVMIEITGGKAQYDSISR